VANFILPEEEGCKAGPCSALTIILTDNLLYAEKSPFENKISKIRLYWVGGCVDITADDMFPGLFPAGKIDPSQ
jgi:hypothetical protein